MIAPALPAYYSRCNSKGSSVMSSKVREILLIGGLLVVVVLTVAFVATQ